MGAGIGNETGHWESSVLADFHDHLLAEYASRWDAWDMLDVTRLPAGRRTEIKREIATLVGAQFDRAPLIVVKDPRICRFTSLFLDALSDGGYDPRCILTLRSPLEVIESLEKRNQMPRGQAALLWLRSTLDSEYATRQRPRVLVDYADLLADWRSVLGRVRKSLGVPFRYSAEEIADQVERFLSPDLRHHHATLEQTLFDPSLRDWVGETYAALLALKRKPSSHAAMETLDRVRQQLDAATPMLQRLSAEADEALTRQRRYFEHEIFTAREQADRATRAAEALDERSHQLAADLESLAVRERDARQRAEVIEKARAEADISRQEAETRATLAEARAAQAESRVTEVETDAFERISVADAARVELARERDQAEARVAEANDRLAASEADAREARAFLSAVEEQHDSARAHVSALETRLHDHETLLEHARQELLLVRRAFETQAAAVASLRMEHERDLARHETTAADAELALMTSLRAFEDKMLDAESAIAAHERRIAQLHAEASTLGARVGRLLSRWRRRLAPPGSWRIRAVGGLARFGERIYRRGPRPTPLPAVTHQASGVSNGDDGDSAHPPAGIVAAAPADYAAWIDATEPTPADLSDQRGDHDLARRGPLISIVLPIYKVPRDVLAGTLQSLVSQTYPKWEACIAYADIENDANWALLEDFARRDPRIRPQRLTTNAGISGNSNAALATAQGEFIGLLDHDDELTPWALHDMAQAIVGDDQADFLYSDKDSVDETGSVRINPLFKPEWSPEMLYSVNYLTHFNVMRRTIVTELGGWRPETDGAQDWDLFLRVTERARRIRRVCGVHYHWRVLPTSVASGIEAKPYATAAQLRTVKDRVERLGLPACVMADQESGFRLSWRTPRVPVVDLIVFGDDLERLAQLHAEGSHDCAAWVASVSIVGGMDDSTPIRFSGIPVRRFTTRGPTDRTAAILEAAAAGTGSVIAFFDADIERASPGWIDELAGWVLGHGEIAFAGSLLLTPADEVLEAGRVLGSSGTSAPLFNGSPLRHWGPLGGPLWFRNVSAVGPHAVACRRALWPAIAPGEMHLDWSEAFVARCEKMSQGGRGLVSPHARMVRSRRAADDRHYWDDTFREDPYFHPGFESVAPLRMRGDGA